MIQNSYRNDSSWPDFNGLDLSDADTHTDCRDSPNPLIPTRPPKAADIRTVPLGTAAATEELLGKLLREKDGTPYLNFLQRIMMEIWNKFAKKEHSNRSWQPWSVRADERHRLWVELGKPRCARHRKKAA